MRAVALPSETVDARRVSQISGVGEYVLELLRQRHGFPSAGTGVGADSTAAPAASYGPEDVALVLRLVRLAERRFGGDVVLAADHLWGKKAVRRARPATRLPLSVLRSRFARALASLDEAGATTTLTTAFAQHADQAVVNRVILPVGAVLASERLVRQPERIGAYLYANICRQALRVQADRYPPASGPVVWLGCPRGELHDVGLHVARLVLVREGWSTRLLGQNCDLQTLAAAARRSTPAAVLLSVSRSLILHRQLGPLRELAAQVPTVLGGPGATLADAEAIGAGAALGRADHLGAYLRDRLAQLDAR